MKGIKECVNWMVDNDSKKITNDGRCAYWNGHEFYLTDDECTVLITNFVKFKEEWFEVIEPVDFLTAYNDCLENGTEYKAEFENDVDLMERGYLADGTVAVSISSEDGNIGIGLYILREWIKQ